LLASICIDRRWREGKESESRRRAVLVVSRKLKESDVSRGMVVNVGFGWKMGSVPSRRKMALWMRSSTSDGVLLMVSSNSLKEIPILEEE
jgi:hypothetical protein